MGSCARAPFHDAAGAQTYVDLYQLHWPARYTPVFSQRRYVRAMERPPELVPSIDEQVQAIGELIAVRLLRECR